MPHSSNDGSTARPRFSDSGLINFVHAHGVELLAFLCICYISVGSLVPFDFPTNSVWTAWRNVAELAIPETGYTDVMSNIALYIPLGLCLHAVVTRLTKKPGLSVIAAVVIATGVSLWIESIQMQSAARIASIADSAANLLGATLGALLAYLSRGYKRRWLAKLAIHARLNPSVASVSLCAWLLFIGAVVPFMPTLDVSRFADAARDSQFVPFARSHEMGRAVQEADQAGLEEEAASLQNQRMEQWATWFVDCLSFLILGWLLHGFLRLDMKYRPGAGLLLAFYLIGGFAVVLSIIQLGIVSRGFDATDVLLRFVAGVLGYWLCGTLIGSAYEGARLLAPAMLQALRVGALCSLAYVLFTGLLPFRFNFDMDYAAQRFASDDVAPFHSYYLGRFDRASADFLGKSLRYIALAAVLWFYGSAAKTSFRWRSCGIVLGIGLMVFTVEAAQLVIRSRVCSGTDVIIAFVGAGIGVVCAQYSVEFYRHATFGPCGQSSMQAVAPESPLTDGLMATLIQDPADNAVLESMGDEKGSETSPPEGREPETPTPQLP